MGERCIFSRMRISKALAMSSAVAKVARPASMRNFIAPVIRKHFVIATVLSVVTTYGYYAAVFAPRREAYRQFYETYEQMKKTGIFQSAAQIAEAAAEAAEEAAGGEE